MLYRLGIDIGGTGAKLGVVDEEFNIVERATVPTAGETADGIINAIIVCAKGLMAKYPVTEAGIGSAGRVVRETGVVQRAGHLPFSNEPVAGRISEGIGLKAAIDNDANCALIGEKAAGACKGKRDAIILTIGTGIGGAVMINGRIYRGFNNRAGELGHFSMDLNGEVCECGLRGCFELQASATALTALTAEYIEKEPESLLAKIAKEQGIDGKTSFAALASGCPTAKKLLCEYGRRLAMGIDSLAYIFQPEVIVLSGGVSKAGQPLLDLLPQWRVSENPVVISRLHGDAGIIGASLAGSDYTL